MEKVRCKEIIFNEDNQFHNYKCLRKAIKDGYCWQHHPDEVAKRERLSEEKFQRKLDNNPWKKLSEAKEKIKELEKENDELKIQLQKGK